MKCRITKQSVVKKATAIALSTVVGLSSGLTVLSPLMLSTPVSAASTATVASIGETSDAYDVTVAVGETFKVGSATYKFMTTSTVALISIDKSKLSGTSFAVPTAITINDGVVVTVTDLGEVATKAPLGENLGITDFKVADSVKYIHEGAMKGVLAAGATVTVGYADDDVKVRHLYTTKLTSISAAAFDEGLGLTFSTTRLNVNEGAAGGKGWIANIPADSTVKGYYGSYVWYAATVLRNLKFTPVANVDFLKGLTDADTGKVFTFWMTPKSANKLTVDSVPEVVIYTSNNGRCYDSGTIGSLLCISSSNLMKSFSLTMDIYGGDVTFTPLKGSGVTGSQTYNFRTTGVDLSSADVAANCTLIDLKKCYNITNAKGDDGKYTAQTPTFSIGYKATKSNILIRPDYLNFTYANNNKVTLSATVTAKSSSTSSYALFKGSLKGTFELYDTSIVESDLQVETSVDSKGKLVVTVPNAKKGYAYQVAYNNQPGSTSLGFTTWTVAGKSTSNSNGHFDATSGTYTITTGLSTKSSENTGSWLIRVYEYRENGVASSKTREIYTVHNPGQVKSYMKYSGTLYAYNGKPLYVKDQGGNIATYISYMGEMGQTYTADIYLKATTGTKSTVEKVSAYNDLQLKTTTRGTDYRASFTFARVTNDDYEIYAVIKDANGNPVSNMQNTKNLTVSATGEKVSAVQVGKYEVVKPTLSASATSVNYGSKFTLAPGVSVSDKNKWGNLVIQENINDEWKDIQTYEYSALGSNTKYSTSNATVGSHVYRVKSTYDGKDITSDSVTVKVNSVLTNKTQVTFSSKGTKKYTGSTSFKFTENDITNISYSYDKPIAEVLSFVNNTSATAAVTKGMGSEVTYSYKIGKATFDSNGVINGKDKWTDLEPGLTSVTLDKSQVYLIRCDATATDSSGVTKTSTLYWAVRLTQKAPTVKSVKFNKSVHNLDDESGFIATIKLNEVDCSNDKTAYNDFKIKFVGTVDDVPIKLTNTHTLSFTFSNPSAWMKLVETKTGPEYQMQYNFTPQILESYDTDKKLKITITVSRDGYEDTVYTTSVTLGKYPAVVS